MENTGIELITEERKEMKDKHGITSKHDFEIGCLGLSEAAAVCASPKLIYNKRNYANQISFVIPEIGSWKLPLKWDGNVLIENHISTKEERIHQLKVAGALCAAAIDVLLDE